MKLAFEQPLLELEEKIDELKMFATINPALDISQGIRAIEKSSREVTKQTFKKLTRWNKVQLARHEHRPQSSIYIDRLFEEVIELHGDKIHDDDRALIGGLGWFEGEAIAYLAQQKGKNLKERQEMNFGYTHPEGYRKALRIMKFAEKFNRPLICFVDTPGAHFDRISEERGQSVAIAENLAEMSNLKIPIIVLLVGEGGSGGALAIAIGDRVLMMEYAIYCVAPPEACSGIVWKDNGEHAPEAADALKPLPDDLMEFGIIDEIIREPIGGSHRNVDATVRSVRRSIRKNLQELKNFSTEELLQVRYERYRKLGIFYRRDGS